MRKFPDDSHGTVYGPDGEPARRTRAHVIHGFTEPVEEHHLGRNQSWMDEEGAWLNNSAHFQD